MPPQRANIATFTRHGDSGVVSLFDDGEQRRELLERVRCGEVVELLIDAQTYAQGEGVENRNFEIFSPEALESLVSTAAGTPFARDHSLRTEDKAGHAKSAELRREQGVDALQERLEVVKPWAVEAALDGTMTHFSISTITPWGDVECGYCGNPVLLCDHWPGDLVEGADKHVVWIHRSAEWVERSWVVRPAVTDTGLIGWTQLYDLRNARARARKPERRNMNIKELLKLSADADENAVTAKVRTLLAENEQLRARYQDLEAAATQGAEELEKVRAELADLRTAEAKREADAEIEKLVKEGRIRAEGKQEELIRAKYDAGDIEGARALVAAFSENSPIAPVGRQSTEKPAPAAVSTDGVIDYAAAFAALPEHIRSVVAKHKADPEKLFAMRPDLLDRVTGPRN